MPPMADAAAYLPRRFRFVVFDWDGTLADSTTIIAEALQQACRDIGAAVPDDVNARYVIGLGLADALRHVAPDLPPGRQPELVARYRHHYIAREPAISLFAGVREMLAELGAAGIVLGVATGKSRAGLDHALAQMGHLTDGVLHPAPEGLGVGRSVEHGQSDDRGAQQGVPLDLPQRGIGRVHGVVTRAT